MFARRKRRNRDEEEPLVPHGLVWQATERLSAPQEPGQPPLPAADPKPVTIPEQESVPAETNSESQSGARKLGAISPPLAWPPAEIEQNTEQPDSPPDTGSVAAIIEEKAPPSPLEQKQTFAEATASRNEKREPAMSRFRVRTLAEASLVKDRFWSTSARLRGHSRSSVGKAARSMGEFEKKLAANCRVLVFAAGTKLHRLIQSLPMKQLQALPRHAAQALAERISRSRLAWKSQRTAGQSAITERSRQWSQGLVTSMSRVGRRRVHVRIRPLPLWARFVRGARSMSESWQQKPRAAADSRLWMSMTMAVASALLALGLISVIRPYAPASAREPAAAPPASEPEKLNSPNRPLSTPKPLSRPSDPPPARKRTQPVPAAQTISTPGAAKMTHSKPKVRHSADDDYVATDTYTYYGPSGKRSH